MKIIKQLLPVLGLLGVTLFVCGLCEKKPSVKTEWFTDTVYIKEIIRDTVLVPQKVYIARVDTVRLVSADTLKACEGVSVRLPIERKVYETGFYRAVIEGYKPQLLEMSVFPETKLITNTEIRTVRKNPRFGLGIQAGYGFNGSKLKPYVGVGVQYNIITF